MAFLEGCWFLLLVFCLVARGGGGAGVSDGFRCCYCSLFVAALRRTFLVLFAFVREVFLGGLSCALFVKLIICSLTTC